LNATATIHAAASVDGESPTSQAMNAKRAPQVDADFQVTRGSFRQFQYDSFAGTVQYLDSGMTVDATLQQNPTTSISAKGYVPTAIFKPVSPEARAAAHNAPIAPEDRVDLHIESTPMDLGFVQGFTSQLTNVAGTLQAKIDIAGSASDPHPTGFVTIQKGAFTVPATGVPYRDLNGRIDFEEGRVHVGAISVLDNHFNALNISGDLAVHENEVGSVRVYVHADDFKVIDNKMGNLRVNTDLELGGELRAPRLDGDLGVTTGTVNIDTVLAAIGDSAYATTQTEYKEAAAQVPVLATAPQPFTLSMALEALAMNVHVTVPNDLIVKANDLSTPGSPLGLGAMNVTLGGDVRATKMAGDDLVLVGSINTVRGTYTFQGRRFDILRDGTIRFTGDSVRDLDPLLDIRARRLIQAVEARVNIRGSLKQPEVVLESTPPLEQADILSLIVFNQPLNQLGEGQQVALSQRAAQLATGALAGALGQSVEEPLNLDIFEIGAASGSNNAELTIGQQLGQNLFVKIEQQFGNQSQTNFVLEYELTRWLRLRTNALQSSATQQQVFQRVQDSGVDLLFFFSY
jgi:translocation and assembly module TamB